MDSPSRRNDYNGQKKSAKWRASMSSEVKLRTLMRRLRGPWHLRLECSVLLLYPLQAVDGRAKAI